MEHFIGLDISKDSFNYCVINSKKEIEKGRFLMNREGFDAFKNVVLKYEDSAVALESTGSYHANILSFLLSFKKEVCLVNPSLIKNFSKGYTLRKTKTDEVDAFIIARFVLKNIEYMDYFVLSNIDDIKALARLREDVAKDIAKSKTKFKGHLNMVFPELLTEYDIYSTTLLNFIELYPTAELVRNTKTSVIKESLKELRGRSSSFDVYRAKELAKNSIGLPSVNYETVIRYDVEHLKFLMKKIDDITKQFILAINGSRKEDIEILKSIKGISDITASHFMAEIKDIAKFENRNKLIAFAGTDPGIRESGTSLKISGRISKRGSVSLRRYVYLMAVSVIKYNNYFKDYYCKKKEEGFPHRKAIIALVNKLLRIIFALLTRKQKFNMELIAAN
ncbi:MAG: IS110 family RNA-guided transposase [bacterium]